MTEAISSFYLRQSLTLLVLGMSLLSCILLLYSLQEIEVPRIRIQISDDYLNDQGTLAHSIPLVSPLSNLKKDRKGLKMFNSSLLYFYVSREEQLAQLEDFSMLHASALAPLTAKAQRFFFEWQHPSICKNNKFLVSQGDLSSAGIGSNLFVAAHHLSIAIELGYIFLWRWDVAEIYTDPINCLSTPGIECFVDSPSNCTLRDAFNDGVGFKPSTLQVRFANAGQALGIPNFHFVPKAFQRMWAEAGLPEGESSSSGSKDPRAYWFKTQAVAYLLKFNKATSDYLHFNRASISNFMAASGKNVPFLHKNSMLSMPLPSGTISAHIRHGDKGSEMRLIPTKAYFDAALHIADMEPLMSPSKNLFVTTEDPFAIEFLNESLKSLEYSHWSIAWYGALPRKDSNGDDQLNAFSSIIPKANLTRLWFLQLTLALECDSWIGTRGSNWNKLIDMLRCVWVAKCQNYMADVGDNIWR